MSLHLNETIGKRPIHGHDYFLLLFKLYNQTHLNESSWHTEGNDMVPLDLCSRPFWLAFGDIHNAWVYITLLVLWLSDQFNNLQSLILKVKTSKLPSHGLYDHVLFPSILSELERRYINSYNWKGTCNFVTSALFGMLVTIETICWSL